MLSEYLTFGITKKGEWVFIDEVGRGSPELYCPFCKSLLIANKGLARIHYFSHQTSNCHQLSEALKTCHIPTIDHFELLDDQETKYLKQRKQGKHTDIVSWSGMRSAVLRLSAMKILTVDVEVNPVTEQVTKQLMQLDAELLTEAGQPSEKLQALFTALEPLADLNKHWKGRETITATQISNLFLSNQLENQTTLSQLEQAQRYWLDVFCRRQYYLFPEYHLLLNAKLTSLNYQNLYVLEVIGEFPNCPERFITIGMTTRHINFRLTELKEDLGKLGTLTSISVITIINRVGRLEALIHQRFQEQRIELGNHQAFYNELVKDPLLEELSNISEIGDYTPLVLEKAEVVNTPGRKKKSTSQILAEYPEVVNALESHQMSVRKACRATGRASATVQRVKKAMS